MIQEKLDPVINKPHHVQIVKNITTEAVVGERDSLDDHGVHGNIHVDAIVRIPDPVDEHRQHLPVHGDRNRVDYEVVRDSMMMDNSINLDFALSLTIYGLVLLAFVCLYMYFKMLKRKSSLRRKKRYILYRTHILQFLVNNLNCEILRGTTSLAFSKILVFFFSI